MANFNFVNFAVLSQALKKLPKDKRSSYSAIGALGQGGFGGLVPAYALGQAEVARIERDALAKKTQTLEEAALAKSEASQSLYAETGKTLVEVGDEQVARSFGADTRAQATVLGLDPVVINGTEVLPGATLMAPDTKLSDATLGDVVTLLDAAATAIVGAAADAVKEHQAEVLDAAAVRSEAASEPAGATEAEVVAEESGSSSGGSRARSSGGGSSRKG